MPPSPTQPLAGVRVLDGADEKGEFCGRLLADGILEEYRGEADA